MKDISTYDDADQLKQLMANAKRLGNIDVYKQAFRRLCELAGNGKPDALHMDFYSTLAAYEELLTEKNGRTTRANRTRQKLARHGVIKCLEDWAKDPKETQGFSTLVENGLVELTGEFLILKYPGDFSSKAIENARRRLKDVHQREEFKKAFDAAGISFD